ncbi:MAG: 4'-phosphopantetheinyl transferase superfamily protein [Anaerolineales bacterium]|nr:4'-phosphopantetheinyl transferase superfamily protein [Anaerolineales bacterium]
MQQDSWTIPPDSLSLKSHHVDIWCVSSALSADSVKLLFPFLSNDEKQRASRFRFPIDRDRYIVSHGSLRDILGRYLHGQPYQSIFSTNKYGKPSLVDSELEFNLSHSNDFTLIAIAQGRKVGVDVEHIRTDMELENIARRYFSRVEISELMSMPSEQREAGFFNCWTRKEAYIKAQGLGLSLPLDSFDVSLTPDQPAVLRETRPNPQEAACWSLLSLEIHPNYAGALAVETGTLEFRFWDFVRHS